MGATELVCPLCCNETFSSSSALKYHLLSIIANILCPTCHQRFEHIEELAEHLGTLFIGYIYLCIDDFMGCVSHRTQHKEMRIFKFYIFIESMSKNNLVMTSSIVFVLQNINMKRERRNISFIFMHLLLLFIYLMTSVSSETIQLYITSIVLFLLSHNLILFNKVLVFIFKYFLYIVYFN